MELPQGISSRSPRCGATTMDVSWGDFESWLVVLWVMPGFEMDDIQPVVKLVMECPLLDPGIEGCRDQRNDQRVGAEPIQPVQQLVLRLPVQRFQFAQNERALGTIRQGRRDLETLYWGSKIGRQGTQGGFGDPRNAHEQNVLVRGR